jgi:hypothetical protein
MVEVGRRVTGVVIPFPRVGHRARTADDGGAPGEILLFTGVRYERLPDPTPEPSPALDGRSRSGRRRRS